MMFVYTNVDWGDINVMSTTQLSSDNKNGKMMISSLK
jgi:hypothetical protein